MWFDQISFTHLLQAPSNRPLQRFKAEFFQALAHPVRITILEALRDGALTVGDLQERLAIDASSVSQQLAVLRRHNIVEGRRVGSTVYYTVRDPALFHLLDVTRTIFAHRFDEWRDLAVAGEGAADGQASHRPDGAGDDNSSPVDTPRGQRPEAWHAHHAGRGDPCPDTYPRQAQTGGGH